MPAINFAFSRKRREENKMKNKTVLILTLLVFTFGALVTGCSKEKRQSEKEKEIVNNTEDTLGQNRDTQILENKFGTLKSFEAKTLDGNTFTQDNITEKDVTVINFWSLLCGPCIVEMPDIAKFEKSLPDNVQMITVCLDGDSDTQGVESILKDAEYEGITLLTGDGDFEKVSNEIMYTPTTLVVDKEGNIIGDAIIGGQKDLEKVYTDVVNNVLKMIGKEEMENAED